jgi:hypothetical protein
MQRLAGLLRHGYPGALSLLLLFSAYHTYATLRDSARAYLRASKPDPVTLLDRRLRPLREQLSQNGVGHLGYLADEPENGDWFLDYFRTQYALAPVIVADSSDRPLVVTYFRDRASILSQVGGDRFVLVGDYGNGLSLLARDKR